MKIAVRLFLSSMIFAIVIAGAYAWATKDLVGSVLLITMAIAMLVLAIFTVVAEKEANLASDSQETPSSALAGENLGVFSLESYWPVMGAAGTVLLVMGVVFLPGPSAVTALIAAAILFFTFRFLIREST